MALTFLFAISWVVVALAYRHQVGPGTWAAITAFVILTAFSGPRGARLRLGNVDVAAMTLVAVGLQVAWATNPQAPFGPGQRTTVTGAVVVGAFLFASRGARVVAVVIGVGAQVGADWVRVDPASAIGGLWPVVASGIAVAVCIPVMREAARRADAAAADQQRSAARAAAQVGEHRARMDVQGVLHDDVCTALRAISLREVSQDEARRAAQSAVAAVERAPLSADDDLPRDLAQLVLDLPPVPGTVTTIEPGAEMMVPGAVALAAMAATREVLRNVRRHAHAGHVEVVLGRDGDGFALEVEDDGAGFRPATAMSGSQGLRKSVVGRLHEVGGRAEVTSAPGRGTRVRLTWHPATAAAPRQATRAERITAAIGDVRRPLAAVCLPYLAMTGAFALQDGHAGHLPLWLLVSLAGLCAITLALLAGAHTGLMGPVVAAALCYGVGCTIASLIVLAPDSLRDYSSWPLGAIAPLLAVVVIMRPLREAAACLVVLQVTIATAALTGRFGAGAWTAQLGAITPAALSTVQPVVLGMVIVQTILRLGDVVTRANASHRAVAASGATLRAREAVHRHRLDDMSEQILPFLRDIANGATSLATPGVRELSRALEHAARVELHIPGVLDPSARNLLYSARDAGCTITIQAGTADIGLPELVRHILVAALSTGPTPLELVLSVQHTDDADTINLVTIPGDPDRSATLAAEFGQLLRVLDSTREATWAEVSVPAGVTAYEAGHRSNEPGGRLLRQCAGLAGRGRGPSVEAHLERPCWRRS
ncbi:MAG: ATP-binding protein [Actinomycetota bacterium]